MPADLTPPATPPTWRLVRRPHGRVDLASADGTTHGDVDVVRAFPLSAPRGPVAIVAADGTEVVWIESLDAMPEPFRGLIVEELSAREFLPLISRIEAISDTDPAEWSVITDRGERRFTVSGPDDVERLPDSSALVVDTAGVRYRIPSIDALDHHSRRLLDDTME